MDLDTKIFPYWEFILLGQNKVKVFRDYKQYLVIEVASPTWIQRVLAVTPIKIVGVIWD
jgi:hypothetical protein